MRIRLDPNYERQYKVAQQTLRQLPDNMRKQVLGQALGAQAGEIRKVAKKTAPKRTGNLRKAIHSGRFRNRPGKSPAAFVSARNKKGRTPIVNYGFIVEVGVKGKFVGKKYLEAARDQGEPAGHRAFQKKYNQAFRKLGQKLMRKSRAAGYRRGK